MLAGNGVCQGEGSKIDITNQKTYFLFIWHQTVFDKTTKNLQNYQSLQKDKTLKMIRHPNKEDNAFLNFKIWYNNIWNDPAPQKTFGMIRQQANKIHLE